MNQPNAAIDYYRKGKVFARAIELARSVSPEEVTTLEEEWGDWLVSRRQADASISHYIEAGATAKALEAAVQAKQYLKAVQVRKSLSLLFNSYFKFATFRFDFLDCPGAWWARWDKTICDWAVGAIISNG